MLERVDTEDDVEGPEAVGEVVARDVQREKLDVRPLREPAGRPETALRDLDSHHAARAPRRRREEERPIGAPDVEASRPGNGHAAAFERLQQRHAAAGRPQLGIEIEEGARVPPILPCERQEVPGDVGAGGQRVAGVKGPGDVATPLLDRRPERVPIREATGERPGVGRLAFLTTKQAPDHRPEPVRAAA